MSTFSHASSPAPALADTPVGPVEWAACGEGPAVLALHGAMGGFDQGLLLARTVGCPGFRAIAPSRPGYLGTPLAAGRTPDEQADLYAHLLDALGVPDAAVLAVSGGGPSALAFALRHPARCRGLVVISSVCSRIDVRLPLAWHLMKLAARCPPLVAAMRRKVARDPERAARRSIPDAALRARTIRDPEAGPLLHALQLSTLDRMALRLPGTENDIETTRGDLSFPLERISVPLLVLHGTRDRAAPFVQGETLATRAPGAELVRLEDGEHVAIFTHLAQARAHVARFLRAHAATADRRGGGAVKAGGAA